ncbi:MAG: phosphate ABC transporter substrate-binding protein PstS [Thermodesulfobacteriota bacterium]
MIHRRKPNGSFGAKLLAMWMVPAIAVLVVAAFHSAVAAPEPQESLTVHGAGASFPYPVYAKWGDRYHRTKGLRLNYQSIGSGGGIAQIKAKTVDFGASDAPLKPEELDNEGLTQFPLVMGGVVPVVNVPNVWKGRLKLTPELLAQIFLGEITKWNDRRIMAVNHDLKIPDMDITVCHRADKSGTTWIFTNYLTKISPAWKEKVGHGSTVSWPTGVGGKGNEGVSVLVRKTKGAIGYVEFAYALKERLPYVSLQNNAGKFVVPTIESFQAAASNADWSHSKGFYMVLTDQPGDGSWPIVGASYILLHREQPDKAKAAAMLQFFHWCFKNGADHAVQLHYVPIPQKVYGLVESAWEQEIKTQGDAVAWK